MTHKGKFPYTPSPKSEFLSIQSISIQFKSAACRLNQWQDCYSQGDRADCENEDRRDCKWVGDRCVPKFTPGFDFWNTESGTPEICAQANDECVIKFEVSLGGKKECIENCECLGTSWEDEREEICMALGDCGSKTNYLGINGWR